MPRNLISPDTSPVISSPSGDSLVSELVCVNSAATSAQATAFGDGVALGLWGGLIGSRNLANAEIESQEATVSVFVCKPLGVETSLESEIAEIEASVSHGLSVSLLSSEAEIDAEFEKPTILSISPALTASGATISSFIYKPLGVDISLESEMAEIEASLSHGLDVSLSPSESEISAECDKPTILSISPALTASRAAISAFIYEPLSINVSLEPKTAEIEASGSHGFYVSLSPDEAELGADLELFSVIPISPVLQSEPAGMDAAGTKLEKTTFGIEVSAEKATVNASAIQPVGFSITVSPETATIETSTSTLRGDVQTIETPEALMIAKASAPDRENYQLYRVVDIQYTPDGQFKTLFLQAAKRPVTR